MKGARALMLIVVAASSGCSGLLQSSAPVEQAYVLRAARSATPVTTALDAPSLRIGRTLVAPGLDSDRIVLVRSDHRVDYFALSRWIAPVPQLVEDLAAETLRSSGGWSSVHDSGSAFPAEFYLQLDIRRFEADYTQGEDPTVHVVLDCTFGRRTDREVLIRFAAEGSAAAGANKMSAVIAAFESAARAALATVAQRTQEGLRTSTARSTP